jgi:hypothetical protein
LFIFFSKLVFSFCFFSNYYIFIFITGDCSNQDFLPITPQTVKVEIPRISSRDLEPQRPHSPCQEFEQYGFLFNGLGYKREPNKITVKHKIVELEEGVKKAKKFALEQSVRFVLIKQQQQQQKQQLDLIKKQQALLLMCRLVASFCRCLNFLII